MIVLINYFGILCLNILCDEDGENTNSVYNQQWDHRSGASKNVNFISIICVSMSFHGLSI